MNVRCESCGVQLKVNPEKLKGLYNKKIKFPCKNCGNDIKIHVTADFLNQKKVPEKKFHTDVIDDRANNKTSSELLQLKIIENDYTKAQLLKLNIGENIIGRASSDEKQNKVAVVTNDMEMSREHCLITVEKTNEKFQYILKDCKSTNGTYHNGIKLSEHDEVFISKESQIEIGITLIKLI